MQSSLQSKKKKMKKSSRDMESNLPEHDNRPCFYKIIQVNHKASNSLIIPPHFVTTHLPKRMPSEAVLKGPSGDCWNITVCQQKGNTIMQHGWQQFYQDHSLGDNEFLLFRHNGNMCFDVQIFYKSGCERKIVSITRTHRDSIVEIKEEEIDFSKIGETEPQVQTSGKGKRKSTAEKNSPSSSRKQSRPPAARKSKGNLSKAAEDFTSKFPHFKHCLTRANVEKPFLLAIPCSFVKANLPQARREFTFSTSKQKSWKVTYIYSEINKVFSKGWRGFAIDNKLKMGDSCVFELVAPQKMRVHIFPH
ncbi:B3 domain-containing protein Os01g0723500-like [Durio zibethinus]|uniref:B3 domain-containing protein Os01g0723500-like n=1 Tax=Durio zibethinus TaxID=66656 RepID=A0A6P5X9I4_DURZI|nr:B3 domain-containing protein Os01g0723500-like [Durio zibethinus]